MPEVTFKFHLPEETGEFNTHRKAGIYYCALHEVLNAIRNKLKHGDPTKEVEAFGEELREVIRDEVDEYDL